MRSPVLAVLLLISCAPSPQAAPLANGIHEAEIRKFQEFLGSPDLEGRGPGTEGSRKASDYIAAHLKEWGLTPAGTDGGWFQPFGEGRRNVAALRPGRSDEYVVVGAHYDHLGRKGDAVFPGADDNASGTSTVLDVAESASRASLGRSVLFVWFDAEENRLEGSRWWTEHPTLPIGKCFAMVNVDMIGRNATSKVFCGVQKDKAKEPVYPRLASALKEVEAAYGPPFDWTEFDPYIQRSDHWPFMEKGVPSLFFTGGMHADYHKEGDRLEKINFEKEERVGKIVATLLESLSNRSDPLK
jgi:hypothetical protein